MTKRKIIILITTLFLAFILIQYLGILSKSATNKISILGSDSDTAKENTTPAYNISPLLTGNNENNVPLNRRVNVEIDNNYNIIKDRNRGNFTTVSYSDNRSIVSYSDTRVSAITQNNKQSKCPNKSYIPISTARALQRIEGDKNYCLVKDIILTTEFEPIGYNNSSNKDWNFRGTEFTGKFDGNEKTIINLTIKKPDSYYVGLFAKIGKSGEARNLIIKVPVVHGGIYVGVLAGQNDGKVTNVRVKAEDYSLIVKGEEGNIMKGNMIGGLVGYNFGSISNSYTAGAVKGTGNIGGLVGANIKGNILNCYSTGNVKGAVSTGGLVGGNMNGTISNSYSTAKVGGVTNTGGLVGVSMGGGISNSYAAGAAKGTSNTGGLVGQNTLGSKISNSYATAYISGLVKAASLVGTNYPGGTVTNSYFNKTDTVKGIGHGDTSGAIGIEDSKITFGGKQPFQNAGWDFSNIWKTLGDKEWPKLKWQKD